MGQTIWVDVEGRAKDEAQPDNSIMMRLSEQLAALADKLQVSKLSDFYDYSELMKEFGEEGSESWFEPESALKSVSAIHQHLSKHPEDLGFTPASGKDHWPDSLMNELVRCEATLRDAIARKKKFRFLIVP